MGVARLALFAGIDLYLVEVSPAASAAALDLAAYLRSSETQQWLASFGRGKYDDQPLFFPVGVL